MPATVLFACVHNAGRSQMAVAFFDVLANPERARAMSAGTEPAAKVHPEVLAAMLELGLDLSAARPQLLTPELVGKATLLITMGCGEACPVVSGVRVEDWPLTDPQRQSANQVRQIRDEVQRRVTALIEAEGWA